MRATEIINEGRSQPCIVVDLQPEYCGIYDGNENPICADVINFVANQTGPVLMFLNAEISGLTGDSVASVKEYWEDTVREQTGDYENLQPINWNRFKIIDKGYGYFRSWMDQNVSPSAIIKVIRALYQYKKSDSRELEEIDPDLLKNLVGSEYETWMSSDPIYVQFPISPAEIKLFNNAYIMGGGRNECLREVELLMNAFNIKYKRIDSLVYG